METLGIHWLAAAAGLTLLHCTGGGLQVWQHFEALSGQGACSGLSPLREEGPTLSQFTFISLSSQESHTKEIECIISWFLKGNCVSRACKTHSTSIIKMHQRKWLTRSSGLARLQKMIRGLNDYHFLFTGEQKLWDTIQGFLSFKAAENQWL